ncbi:MAG TPA: serine/threonine-protein kinase [Candidatus Sericytochromatia bacterium]
MLQAEQVLQRRYQLQRQIGQNPGRQTWLAQDVEASPAELVIVKLLAFSPQMQWDEFKLFEREAQVLKQLNHPRIPRYRDYFSMDKETGAGLCWFGLVQQYIPGASLRQLLNEGKRFTEKQVRKIATDVLEILIYLHELEPSVLHRDIKPSNLIFGEDEQVYLVDFGAVQNQAATEGVTFTVVGTTGYAPLEQFWGKSVPASDLYALGATLIHLLTGTAPADLPQQDLRIQFSERVSINPNFTRWIEALTAPGLNQRFSTAPEALEALETGHSIIYSSQEIRYPAHSKVWLRKSAVQLSIEMHRSKTSPIDARKIVPFLIKQIFVILMLLPFWLVAILIITSCLIGVISIFFNVGTITSLESIIILLIWLVILLGFGGVLVLPVSKELWGRMAELKEAIVTSFGYEYIYLNRLNLELGRRLFFLRDRHTQHLTSEIKNIKAIPYKWVRIHTPRETYCFGQELTESERRWLAQELQNWLIHRV